MERSEHQLTASPEQPASAAEAVRRVGLYIRVSTDQQDTARQHRSVPELAASCYPDVETVTFTDDGVSAFHNSIFDRPGSKAMLETIKRGEVRAIVADEQSRLCRGGTVEWAMFYDLCREAGVEVVTVSEGLIRDDDTGELIALITNWKNRRESIDKAHRIKTGKLDAAKDGYWTTGNAPLGYSTAAAPDNPKRLILVANEEADAIRIAFESFAAEPNVSRVADELTENLGRRVPRPSVIFLLRNAHYAGWIVYNDERIEGRHDAIVPRELFERVQRVLNRNADEPRRPTRVQPFTEVTRCAYCRRRLRYHPVSNGGSQYAYFRCDNKECPRKETSGQRISVPAEVLEAQFVLHLACIGQGIGELLENADLAPVHRSHAELAVAEAAVTVAKERWNRIRELFRDGDVTKDEPIYQETRADLDNAEAAVQRLSATADDQRLGLETLYHLTVLQLRSLATSHSDDPQDDFLVLLSGWQAAPLEVKRQIIRHTVNKVVIGCCDWTWSLVSHVGDLRIPYVQPEKRYRGALENAGFGCFPEPNSPLTVGGDVRGLC